MDTEICDGLGKNSESGGGVFFLSFFFVASFLQNIY